MTVWLIRPDPAESMTGSLARSLDATERRRAAAFPRLRDRHRFEAVHGAARLLAGRRLGVRPADLRWVTGENGKPSLGGVHLSLSYGEDLCLLALAPRPVGIDIQGPGLVDAVAGRFFSAGEASAVSAGPGAGIRLWVRKEALVKAAGGRLMDGLHIPVDRPGPVPYPGGGIYRITDVPVPGGCRAAVALSGPSTYDVSVRLFRGPTTESQGAE